MMAEIIKPALQISSQKESAMRKTFNNMIDRFLAGMFVLVILMGCSVNGDDGSGNPPNSTEDFKKFWYAGKAELTHYHLEQARYGEIHSGDAVLIFVTEDFLGDKQVKYERGPRPDNLRSVMKLNFTRHFFTGIYPYSMITSVFTPVESENASTLKVSSSVQEWCGHAYMQLNLRDNKYKGLLHSYFQSEADQEFELDKALLEDEIWTKIRLEPDALPVGEIRLIPGLQFLRLRHTKTQAETATATLTALTDTSLSDKPLKVYRVEYHDISRVLEITFESTYPYAIVAWQEKTRSGFGPNEKWLNTRAVKTKTLWLDYWTKHSVADSTYRKQLGMQ